MWASASRPAIRILRSDGDSDSFGPCRQVSRLGLPLINEAVIGLQDKDKCNRKRPKDDLDEVRRVLPEPGDRARRGVRRLLRRGRSAGRLRPSGGLAALKSNRTDIIDVINLKNIPTAGAHNITTIGDVLRVDLGIDSAASPTAAS